MLFKHVFVVGAGGIGSHLAEPLTRLLAYHEKGTKNLNIIDGDFYEEKNRIRQLFSADLNGLNKSEATIKRLANSLGYTQEDCPYKSIPSFIDRIKFCEIIGEQKVNLREDLILVIMAVDNHATRKDIILALESYPLENQNFVYISGGNGYANGQVMVYAKVRGKSLTGAHPFDKYADLKYPDDHIPGDGCQDEAPSTPQLITANAAAAMGILWTVQAMLDGLKWFEELHFDSQRMKMVPQGEARQLVLEEELIAALPSTEINTKEIVLPAALFGSPEEEKEISTPVVEEKPAIVVPQT